MTDEMTCEQLTTCEGSDLIRFLKEKKYVLGYSPIINRADRREIIRKLESWHAASVKWHEENP